MKIFASAVSHGVEVIWLADENVTPRPGRMTTVPSASPGDVVLAAVGVVLGRVTSSVVRESEAVGEDAARVGDAVSPPVAAVRAALGSVPHAASATRRSTGTRRLFTHEWWQFWRVSAAPDVTERRSLP
jgi:hypothetical protein